MKIKSYGRINGRNAFRRLHMYNAWILVTGKNRSVLAQRNDDRITSEAQEIGQRTLRLSVGKSYNKPYIITFNRLYIDHHSHNVRHLPFGHGGRLQLVDAQNRGQRIDLQAILRRHG